MLFSLSLRSVCKNLLNTVFEGLELASRHNVIPVMFL